MESPEERKKRIELLRQEFKIAEEMNSITLIGELGMALKECGESVELDEYHLYLMLNEIERARNSVKNAESSDRDSGLPVPGHEIARWGSILLNLVSPARFSLLETDTWEIKKAAKFYEKRKDFKNLKNLDAICKSMRLNLKPADLDRKERRHAW